MTRTIHPYHLVAAIALLPVTIPLLGLVVALLLLELAVRATGPVVRA